MFLDLLSIKFWLDYSTKPMHFFGIFGLIATGAGIVTGSLLLFQKLFAHAVLASNSSLTFATIALLLAGVQIMCLGLVSEILSRTYYESQQKPIYVARATKSSNASSGFNQEVVDTLGGDIGRNSENQAGQSPLPAPPYAERPILVVSADQPRLVRKVRRNSLA